MWFDKKEGIHASSRQVNSENAQQTKVVEPIAAATDYSLPLSVRQERPEEA